MQYVYYNYGNKIPPSMISHSTTVNGNLHVHVSISNMMTGQYISVGGYLNIYCVFGKQFEFNQHHSQFLQSLDPTHLN